MPDKEKKKRILFILPAELPFSFEDVRKKVSDIGVNFFAQQVMAGFWTSEMQKLRLDQVHTALHNHVFIADLVDENNVPERWENILKFLGRFMSLDSLSVRAPSLITPDLIMNVVRESNPEAFSLIINSDAGGPKWFHDQANYAVRKVQDILRGIAHGR